MSIRQADESDFAAIWPIFEQIAAAGDTYAYSQTISRQDAYQVWMTAPARTYVIEQQGQILGTYYIKTNHAGPGAHVCNCGYMVSHAARGRGLAAAMCEHSQQVAVELGYQAMQFNFVASSNEAPCDCGRNWDLISSVDYRRLSIIPSKVMSMR